MAQTVSLSASPRQATGKGAARQARFRGRVPAVIYGHGRDTQPLELEAKALEKALQGVEPASTIIDLAVDGKTVKTLIREIQRHPIRTDIIHVDFYEIHATEKVKLKVPVHLVGNPDGVRNAGGVLDQVTREVEIEVLPENIPDRVELDVTALKVGEGEEEEGEGAAEGGAPAKPEAKGGGAAGAAPAKPEKAEKPKGGKES